MGAYSSFIGGILEQARRRAEGEEREEVAAEVRLAVARSGLSKAHFAARIGTSPSRLSTYLSGKVTPYAALMLRMRRLADRLSAQRIAAAQAEVGPAREVTIAAGELEAVLEGDGGEMGVGHEPHGGLRAEQRLEDVQMPRPRFRNPRARA
jgi:transcriptional regulator with XRE-family HTH domain